MYHQRYLSNNNNSNDIKATICNFSHFQNYNKDEASLQWIQSQRAITTNHSLLLVNSSYKNVSIVLLICSFSLMMEQYFKVFP